MNKVNYEQTGGFPLDTTNLNFLQNCFGLLNSLGELAGNKAIISGCEKVGDTTITNGVVFFNGEIFEFRGGTLGKNIIIKEEAVSGTFEDGSFKPIEITRYMTFGSSTPEKTFAWEDFKRFDNLVENAEKNADFEKRLKALENKKSPVPIGLIAIWGKPESEPIPEGWKECTDLRGRFPLGWNPDDKDFNELGKVGGDKAHTLTIDEMPNITGTFPSLGGFFENGTGIFKALSSGQAYITGGASNFAHKNIEAKFGNNQPHNNMPPYRIIKFIEFVGFDD